MKAYEMSNSSETARSKGLKKSLKASWEQVPSGKSCLINSDEGQKEKPLGAKTGSGRCADFSCGTAGRIRK